MSMLTTVMLGMDRGGAAPASGHGSIPLPPPSSTNGLGTPPCPDERCIATRRALRHEVARLGAALAESERERDALRAVKVRAAADWAEADVLALGIDAARLAPQQRRALAELLPVGSRHTSADLLRRVYGGVGAPNTITTLLWRLRVALGGQPYTVRGGGGNGVYWLEAATAEEVARGRYVPRPQPWSRHHLTPERARAVLAHPDCSCKQLARELRMGRESIRAIRDGTHPVLLQMRGEARSAPQTRHLELRQMEAAP
jgi:hypothetical protein